MYHQKKIIYKFYFNKINFFQQAAFIDIQI